MTHGSAPAPLDLLLGAKRAGYFLVNQAFTIQTLQGALPGFLGHASPGDSLLTIFPELIGSEETLCDLFKHPGSQFVLPMINRDGVASGGDHPTTHYVNLTIVVASAEDTMPAGFFVLWEDVTQRGAMRQRVVQQRNELSLLRAELARKNERLLSANLELQRANDLKSKFVGMAAHELRTPLTSILGYVELLKDADFGELQGPQVRFAEQIERSAQRLLHLTNNLLDVTQIEAGKLELLLEPVALAPVIDAAIAEAYPKAEQKAQTIHTALTPDMPMALCDRTRVEQVLMNLLDNAIKYTPSGGEIQIRYAPDGTPGFLAISVVDTGVGIPAEDQEHLFVSFYRSGNAATGGAFGAGLGLSIARSLVEQHGGKIWFESVEGSGAKFHFTLPAAQ